MVCEEDVVKVLEKAKRLSKMYDNVIFGQFGGRRSIVIYDIAKRNNIPINWHYFPINEPEENEKFIRTNYNDVVIEERKFTLKIHSYPSTKNCRWCCQEYSVDKAGVVNICGAYKNPLSKNSPSKNYGTEAENLRRAKQDYKHLNEDRHSASKEMEVCCRNSKDTIIIYPLLNITDEEIESYLTEHNLPHLSKSICIGCPMESQR